MNLTLRVALVVIGLVLVGCSTGPKPGTRVSSSNNFERTSYSGVALGNYGDTLNDNVWIRNPILFRFFSDGVEQGTYLRGRLVSDDFFRAKKMAFEVDGVKQEVELDSSNYDINISQYGATHYETILAQIPDELVERMSKAISIRVRLYGYESSSNVWLISDDGREAYKIFYTEQILKQPYNDPRKPK